MKTKDTPVPWEIPRVLGTDQMCLLLYHTFLCKVQKNQLVCICTEPS